jgi:hypothetical protein
MLRSYSRRFLSVTAIFAVALAFHGVQAQVGSDSEWTTAEGDIRIRANATSHYPRDNWRSGMGARDDAGPHAFIEMQGNYQNLRWQGEYWIMGAEASWRPSSADGSYRPAECVGTRPNGYTSADDARDYGEFDVIFNAAESAFTGQKRWICRYADGRTRKGPWVPFNGTRKGLLAAAQNTVRAPSGAVSPAPTGGTSGSGGPPRNPLGDCRDMERVVLFADGQQIRLNRRYGIRPCSIDATTFEKFQIDFINPEGKRPTQLFLRAIQITGGPGINPDTREIVMPSTFTGRTAFQNLPFMGDPRPGSAWFNLLMPGSFCSSAFWLANLKYSDGSQSEPISVLTSECGARNHPEELSALRTDEAPEIRGRAKPQE